MNAPTLNSKLSRRLLVSVATSLEATHRQWGYCNHLAAKYAGNASLLLKFGDLADRFSKLISGITAEQYNSGVISSSYINIVPDYAKRLDDSAQIENKHPIFPDPYIPTIVNNSSEMHLFPCLSGDYKTAFANAKCPLQIEEIILTQAILGNIDLALESVWRLSDRHRKANVYFVVAIELFRHDRLDRANEIYNLIDAGILDIWGASQMALGIANRIPWEGYPYPDY